WRRSPRGLSSWCVAAELSGRRDGPPSGNCIRDVTLAKQARPYRARRGRLGRFRSVESGPYGGRDQCRQLRDVVEGVELEHGLLDRALAVRGDHRAGQTSVLGDDIRIGEQPVAGPARM